VGAVGAFETADRRIGRRLQPKVREQAAQFRELAGRAVHASWTVEWARSILFSTGIGVFLGLVGAFGTNGYPVLPRLLVFTFIGLGAGLIVAGCVALAERRPFLATRPALRRVVISLAVAPLTGVWVWLVISFVFLHGPNLEALLISLGYTMLLTGPMAVLSWLVFRPRIVMTPGAAAAPKFAERLPVRLRGAEIYAVEAEDHYLRLHTSRGTDLILMRLSDAVAELDGLEGAQVHRSWWVAKTGLADVRRLARRTVLKLKDGAEAPVSRANLRQLRDAGWF
jgi:hypothetical protein